MKAIFLLLALLPTTFGSEKLKIIEGDIVVDKVTQDIMDGKSTLAYGGMTSRLWPGGVIPYIFDTKFDDDRVKAVNEAIEDYNKLTCIRFVPRGSETNYVRFKKAGGCYSSIGMIGGRQTVSLGNGCDHKSIAIHEMMHAAGFFHEQSRLDRDQHVKIHWDNIRVGMEFNFQKYKQGEADTFGTPYDFDSVMHYHRKAFGLDKRKPTITAIGDPDRQLGNRKGFSPIDVIELNKMYGCGNRPLPTVGPTQVWTERPTPQPGTDKPHTVPPGCRDHNSKSCAYWKRVGYCNDPQVKKDCCKTCSS